MEKKGSLGIYVGAIGLIIFSCLSFLGEGIPYAIVHGGWTKAITFLALTEPFRIVLGPFAYIIMVLRLYVLVSLFFVVCGVLLLKRKDWTRKVLIGYCWANLILLFIGYFLEKLFHVGLLQVLNGQTLSLLMNVPDFKTAYLHELNPINQYFYIFFLYFIVPAVLNGFFIFYFTRTQVKEQFRLSI